VLADWSLRRVDVLVVAASTAPLPAFRRRGIQTELSRGHRERRPGTRQQEALHERDAKGGNDAELLPGLDSLAHGAHAFSTAVLEDVLDQAGRAAAFLDPPDHRHVHLHEVRLEQRQVIEARVPGPEIVDGDAEPGRAQRRDALARAREVAELRGLGELEDDALGPGLQRRLCLDSALLEELEGMHVEEQQLVRRQLVDGGDLDLSQDASERRYLAAPLRRSEEIEVR